MQFKNPNVQVVLLKNTEALPAVKVFYCRYIAATPECVIRPSFFPCPPSADGRRVMLDVEDKPADNILQELSSIAGKLE